MDYEGDFPEQDSTISMLKNPLGNRSLVFKQFVKDGPYLADNGWKIMEYSDRSSDDPAQWNDRVEVIDEQGRVVEEDTYLFVLETRHLWMETYSFGQRKRRRAQSSHPDLCLQPEHFPQGTIFEVHPSVGDQTQPLQSYTVDRLERNGVRSWVIVTTTMRPGIRDKAVLEPFTINIDWATKILQRGHGPLIIDPGARLSDYRAFDARSLQLLKLETGLEFPPAQRGEVLFYDPCNAISAALHDLGRWSDRDQIDRRRVLALLRRQGLMREHRAQFHSAAPWVNCADLHYVRYGALRKWLEKNHHRVRVPVKTLLREEAMQDQRDYENHSL